MCFKNLLTFNFLINWFWRHWFNNFWPAALLMSLIQYGEDSLQIWWTAAVMVNYACGFNQSKTGKYFEWIIITNHNQLLFTKFGENLRHIESMTSKVEPSENDWTNDVKIFAKLNQWRQKYSPPQIIEPLTEKTWRQGCVIFGERK